MFEIVEEYCKCADALLLLHSALNIHDHFLLYHFKIRIIPTSINEMYIVQHKHIMSMFG